jgi:hypothetical protein
MGWLITALLALLVAGLLALAVPTVFGPVIGALAPLIVVVAVIGLGGVWWRHGRSRVDAEATDERRTAPPDDVRGEDDRVET